MGPPLMRTAAVRAAGTATAEEARAAVRMLQNMGDDKIKEEANALTARSEAPPIALVTHITHTHTHTHT
jgi:hypothetical protein